MSDSNNNVNNNNNNNWLGFSLSPHMNMNMSMSMSMNMESPCSEHHQQQYVHEAPPSTDCGFFLNNGAFLSAMPLKSDGSLCILEALSTSQGMVNSSSPKLEDYLGGHSSAMPLSLDSFYYQNPNWVDHNMNNHVVDNGSVSEIQTLSLTMSPGSQSSCVTAPVETKKRVLGKVGQKQPVHRKSIDTFGQRTSQYRGVTRHRWTGRYEAHLWDNSCKKEGQTRKGRQVYLGGYDMEDKAARAYDLAALKYWGASTHINFPLENYQSELEGMKNMSRQEYVAHLRRKSSGFSRGASMYRGVTRHHQHGRWQARIGRVAGNKDLYLGTFSTQEEAAEAYDVAAIKFRGVNAVTNFDITRYDVERIMASNTLLAGEQARRTKAPMNEIASYQQNSVEANIHPATKTNDTNGSDWNLALYQDSQTNSYDQDKSMSYKTSSFSMAVHDLITENSNQPIVEESSTKAHGQGANHFSNASSLVTSVSSSREASPDKAAMFFGKPPVSSWFTTAPTAMSHLPLFAAWNDA